MSRIRGTCFLVTRSDYGRLLTRYPGWMASVWPRIVKRWNIGGAVVDDAFYKRISFLLSK